MTETLPRPIGDIVHKQWMYDLAEALGYTTLTILPKAADGNPIVHADDKFPTIWWLPENPFAFIEATNEVLVYEVDGETDERGERFSRPGPDPREVALKPVRYPMPAGFELVDVTTPDGAVHRIALRKAAS